MINMYMYLWVLNPQESEYGRLDEGGLIVKNYMRCNSFSYLYFVVWFCRYHNEAGGTSQILQELNEHVRSISISTFISVTMWWGRPMTVCTRRRLI